MPTAEQFRTEIHPALRTMRPSPKQDMRRRQDLLHVVLLCLR